MHKLYVVPEAGLRKDAIPFIQKEKEYQLHELDYPQYGKVGMYKQAESLGMKNFDVAIPIGFVRECVKLTGQNPVGHVVMNYDHNMCGNLVGITREGKMLMDIFNHIQNQKGMEG